MFHRLGEWLTEKVFDCILGYLGGVFKNGSFEKVLFRSSLIFGGLGVILFVADTFFPNKMLWIEFHREENAAQEVVSTMSIAESGMDNTEFPDDNNGIITDDQSHDRQISIYDFLAIIFLVFCIALFFAWGILKSEKKSNLSLTRVKRRELQRDIARQSNELLGMIKSCEREFLIPTTWKFPSGPTASPKETQLLREAYDAMKVQILAEYERICDFIVQAVYEHVRMINSDDTVHVSIKAFTKGDKGEVRVMSFGHATRGKMAAVESPFDKAFKSWAEIDRASFPLSEDYALSRVCTEDRRYSVFCCGNIDEFKANQDEGDSFGRYRRPAHLLREYNATIVCPIYYIQSDNIKPIGAICIDVTSAYEDWDNHGSYEENLLTFVSSAIAPMMRHNIEEFNWAASKLNELFR